jgi:hypothetical protein
MPLALFAAVCILAWLLPAPPHGGREAVIAEVVAPGFLASAGGEGPSDELQHYLAPKKLRRAELAPLAASLDALAASMRPAACWSTPAPVVAADDGGDCRTGLARVPRLPAASQLRLHHGQAPPAA